MERAKHVNDIGDWVHISTVLSKVWENINKAAQSHQQKSAIQGAEGRHDEHSTNPRAQDATAPRP